MKEFKTKFAITAFAATVALAATSARAGTADPNQITCKHTEMATQTEVSFIAEYVLKSTGKGKYETRFTKYDGAGKKVQEIQIAADEYPLTCYFGSKNALVFSCQGGSRMTPFYSSSQKLTTERIGSSGDIEPESYLQVSIYKGGSWFPPRPDDRPTEVKFAPTECVVE